jgi:two-component system, NtrC family, C4-dicarboxylate transport response regulator DctD
VADTDSSNHHINNNRSILVPNNSNRSILVLDDELDIVSIIEQSLQGIGFRVSGFTDPVVALEYFYSNFKDCCNIVISDIRMPGMNGYEFANKVKGFKPECKIILMSAFDINNVEFPKVLQGVSIDTFLQKPFSMKKLKDLIIEKFSN